MDKKQRKKNYNRINISSFFPKKKGINESKLQMTKEGFYSMTSPKDAQHISNIIKYTMQTDNIVITDATANNGGNTINFATNFKKVNSVEIDEFTYNVLKNNVKIFKLEDNVEFHCEDYTKIMKKLKQDVIFFDPPWGGSNYKRKKSLKLYLSGINLEKIVNDLKNHAKMIVLKVPYNFDLISFTKNYTFANSYQLYKFNKYNVITFSHTNNIL